ncbi:hypothetical protein BV898_15172 [Hypsibius exemplaris]|uniref:Uncharacterized protein n=1 Tax=Hypsibius exemplaris TaxID=2072580 RepID=A0A9X6RK90_HYPEX|nr:hypothetical protein BV898_15172 [Hypsibius exemplaris]
MTVSWTTVVVVCLAVYPCFGGQQGFPPTEQEHHGRHSGREHHYHRALRSLSKVIKSFFHEDKSFDGLFKVSDKSRVKFHHQKNDHIGGPPSGPVYGLGGPHPVADEPCFIPGPEGQTPDDPVPKGKKFASVRALTPNLQGGGGGGGSGQIGFGQQQIPFVTNQQGGQQLYRPQPGLVGLTNGMNLVGQWASLPTGQPNGNFGGGLQQQQQPAQQQLTTFPGQQNFNPALQPIQQLAQFGQQQQQQPFIQQQPQQQVPIVPLAPQGNQFGVPQQPQTGNQFGVPQQQQQQQQQFPGFPQVAPGATGQQQLWQTNGQQLTAFPPVPPGQTTTGQQSWSTTGQQWSTGGGQNFGPNGQPLQSQPGPQTSNSFQWSTTGQGQPNGQPQTTFTNQIGTQPARQPNLGPNGQANFGPNGQPNFGPNGQPNFNPNGQPNFNPNGQSNLGPNGQPLAGQLNSPNGIASGQPSGVLQSPNASGFAPLGFQPQQPQG